MFLDNCITNFRPNADLIKIKKLLNNKKINALAQRWILHANFINSQIFYNAYLKEYIDGSIDDYIENMTGSLLVDPNIENKLGENRREYIKILLSDYADYWMEENKDRFDGMTGDDLYCYIDHLYNLERIYKVFKYYENELTNNNIEAADMPDIFKSDGVAIKPIVFLYMLAYVNSNKDTL